MQIVRRDSLALLLSFVIASTAFCSFLSLQRQLKLAHIDEALRCISFISLMAGVHLLGLEIYRTQKALTLHLSGLKKGDFTLILFQQILAVLLSSAILDGGNIGQIVIAAVFTYWTMFITMTLHNRPITKTDRTILVGGYFPLAIIIGILAPIVWTLKGLRF